MVTPVERKIIFSSKAFKTFWKEEGPYAYALTSKEFPPVLLKPEEWLFSNDSACLLKELIQFDKLKMKVVESPFNPDNKKILRPDMLSPWKINNFPEEWNGSVCDLFVPNGHLTESVMDAIPCTGQKPDPAMVEAAFFKQLITQMDRLGYVLLAPEGSAKYAGVTPYLKEWEKDEQDAGLH